MKGRPALDVADIFRVHGPAWREAQRGHLSLGQLKVMSAITQCRTAALGGHVLRCDGCGTDSVSYNSCPMWSLPIRGVRRSKEGQDVGDWYSFGSPLRLRPEQRDESVWRPELALAQMRRHDCFDGFQLLAGVGSNVDLGRGQSAVPQPE